MASRCVVCDGGVWYGVSQELSRDHGSALLCPSQRHLTADCELFGFMKRSQFVLFCFILPHCKIMCPCDHVTDTGRLARILLNLPNGGAEVRHSGTQACLVPLSALQILLPDPLQEAAHLVRSSCALHSNSALWEK